MPKAKYYFNTDSLKYEKVVVSFKKRFWRVIGWLSSALVFGSIVLLIAYNFLDSPKEKQLKREINEMELQYDLLQQRMNLADAVLKDLQQRDDQIYRVIFEAEPIPAEVREAGYGGINRYKELEGYDNSELMTETSRKVDKLSRQIYIQSKSYDEVFELVKQKTVMLASIPGIQPVSMKGPARVASGFGYRIHPIYKTPMMHEGIDFTAPIGTEIYATGNGVVAKTEYNGRGYGNNVVINHGFGYSTLYGHMSRFNVRPGQRVNRGDVIGYVGNTGSSTGPHVHYEVIKGSSKIDPINFFFNDLSPDEYEMVREKASQQNQSFD
ncbi:MAG TPA: peptidoglycan DD-metalloendopeptidase family protein [Bacteroidia bacterium]|jgi:murein DD-endopeptidase MepM/ murein hydrolase activator NlpD|nr:peptidoglycan DD-metalloendopeptidase family protein [Bacteroidia bacterium]HQF28021.1 peptidoglycan DD-metalloendopeptidase family protein [Bacteroidia bacterium]HQK97569.1 peptidoglycan DD-metalloendopeptidase family protein [Bacteroidia bacterium]